MEAVKITVHAAEQYQSRYAPGLSLPQALAALREVIQERRYIGPGPAGNALYVCDSGLEVILKHERGLLWLITVLPPNGGPVVLPPEPPAEDTEPARLRLLDRIHGYLRRREEAGDRIAKDLLRSWGTVQLHEPQPRGERS